MKGMRITLESTVHYCVEVYGTPNPINPRRLPSLGTMVSWSDRAPGDRRPIATKKEWYAATLRQRSICAWEPVAPANLIRDTSSKLIWDANHQIGWVYCTWSQVKAWYRHTGGTEDDMQKLAQQRMRKEAEDYCHFIDGYVYSFVLSARRYHERYTAPATSPYWSTVIVEGENHYGGDIVCNGMLEKFPPEAVEAYHNYKLLRINLAQGSVLNRRFVGPARSQCAGAVSGNSSDIGRSVSADA